MSKMLIIMLLGFGASVEYGHVGMLFDIGSILLKFFMYLEGV